MIIKAMTMYKFVVLALSSSSEEIGVEPISAMLSDPLPPWSSKITVDDSISSLLSEKEEVKLLCGSFLGENYNIYRIF